MAVIDPNRAKINRQRAAMMTQILSRSEENTMTEVNVTAEELRQFIERAEQLAAEKRDIAEHEKEVFAEAKGRGYDIPVMKRIIAMRKKTRDALAEEEAIIDMYKSALGMA